jgi:hypothetical protein
MFTCAERWDMTEDMTAAVKGRHMRKTSQCLRVTCAAIALVLQTFASVAFGQATYTFSTIDVPLPNGQLGFTSLADINDEGQVVGGFTDSLLGPHGFLLDPTKKFLLNPTKNKMRSTAIRCRGKDAISTEPQSIK